MAWFEVFIPASEKMPTNLTLTLQGQNWMDALRTGLSNIGEGPISNIMCDIQADNSIHVTDMSTSRVFRLREVAEPAPVVAPAPAAVPAPAPAPAAPAPAVAAPAPAVAAPAPAVAAPAPAVAAPAPAPAVAAPAPAVAAPAPAIAAPAPAVAAPAVAAPAPAVAAPAPAVAAPAPVAAAPAPAARPAPTPAPPPKREAQFRTGPVPVQRVESAPAPATDPKIAPAASGNELNITDAIADVFEATQDLLMDVTVDPLKVANTLLDLALKKVPAEAGTFYLADVNGHDLSFAAVRGPKADALKKGNFSVKVGQGIIGFSAQEGVCLVIRDMQHDSRYFAAIADAIGYQPRDTLCASAEKDGRLFGAIQLINSKRGGFTPAEMELVRYIGLTAADMLQRAE